MSKYIAFLTITVKAVYALQGVKWEQPIVLKIKVKILVFVLVLGDCDPLRGKWALIES